MAYVTVDVDVDLDEFDDDEIVAELTARGYTVNKGDVLGFDMEDWKLLLKIIDTVPETVYTRRVREKLMNQRWKER